jgi:uncharacterized protein (TIGR03437 family)
MSEPARLTSLRFRATLLAIVTAFSSFGQSASDPVSTVPSAALVAAAGSPFVVGPYAQFIVSGDFNGDGLSDLALVSGGNNAVLTILLATPGGTFEPAPGGPISLGAAYTHLTVADFNGDGNLDIAAVGGYGIEIFLGDGQGGFSLAPTSPIDLAALGLFGANTIGVGDFNHDNKLDLVIAIQTETQGVLVGGVAIFFGNGSGNFAPASGNPLYSAPAARELAVADFNMDGNLDIAITTAETDQVVVLLGDGSGGLLPDSKGPFPTGLLPNTIVHGDFNGDGNVDLAVANLQAGSLTILLGDGTGGFVREPDINIGYAAVPRWLSAADIDGDGILDLALANGGSSVSNLMIFLGDGKGGFEAAASGAIDDPGTPFGLTVGDFNGDGRLDVATANNDNGSAFVFLGASFAVSSLTLSASATPTVGILSSITVSANTSGFRAPTGTVTIRDGATVIATENLTDAAVTFPTTFSTAGVHTLVAIYSGDLRTNGSTSQPLPLNVAKASQAITFPTLPNHRYGDPPFVVSVSSSSGLPVTLTVISGPATIAGNELTLTGSGLVTLQASQSGDANYLAAPNVEQQFQVAAPLLQLDSVLNAASYAAGSLAPGSFAVVFGVDLASPGASSGSLMPTLGGTSIEITDASGHSSNALLYYASPAQINFILPAKLSTGMGALAIQTQAGTSATTPISIAAVDPGLFSADASGTGVAAGSALLVSADGQQTQLPISSCSGTPLVCTAIPIDLGTASDTVYLSLYGTGIRGRSAPSAVAAMIGGTLVNVLYAGSQPNYPGLDQVNLQLSSQLRGRGNVPIVLTVGGTAANVVTVSVR